MTNGPCSSKIESLIYEGHRDMPNFAIGHYDPSILCAINDASCRHLKITVPFRTNYGRIATYNEQVANNTIFGYSRYSTMYKDNYSVKEW
jgi:hypothetical protein